MLARVSDTRKKHWLSALCVDTFRLRPLVKKQRMQRHLGNEDNPNESSSAEKPITRFFLFEHASQMNTQIVRIHLVYLGDYSMAMFKSFVGPAEMILFVEVNRDNT